jgi:glycosyltransferase involved in cell wall biosynthesis
LKVAIYTIALNESKHVERWYESSRSADYHLIADTGSTDDTVARATALGINVIQVGLSPFRFDDARNASLTALPLDIDYCISLDMDEVMVEGWREELEKAHADGITRPGYRFIYAWTEDGKPSEEMTGFRIHARKGYRWKYPIHEVPDPYGIEETKKTYDFQVHHLPDNEKSRGQYLPMLEMAVRENPDARNLYYLGREQSYHNQLDKAAETLKKYLEISVFPEEKSAACRILSKCEPDQAEEWLMKGTEEFASRESILALANYYYTKAMWDECLLVAEKALAFSEKPTQFLAESWAWGPMAYDLAAISCWQLGKWKMALKYGKEAVKISPNDERLLNNLAFYKEKNGKHTK